mgnify:CR=1 FL=1
MSNRAGSPDTYPRERSSVGNVSSAEAFSATKWGSRRPRPGPESALVERFLEEFPLSASRGIRVTLFREPKLDSGFPDLVSVSWHPATADKWSANRARLKRDDLRLLHLLESSGPLRGIDLDRHGEGRASTSLKRLVDLGLARMTRAGWRSASARATFAVRKIVAFEAKVADLNGAVAQASLNRWFASESYILVPRAPRASIEVNAKRHGVGIWVVGSRRPLLAAADGGRQPVSYASWLFNEWAWRTALSVKGEKTP